MPTPFNPAIRDAILRRQSEQDPYLSAPINIPGTSGLDPSRPPQQFMGQVLDKFVGDEKAVGDEITPDYNSPVDFIAGGMGAKLGGALSRGAESIIGNEIGTVGKVKKVLPMDEASRMARAKEMGFDTEKTYYHGSTRNDIHEFDPNRSKTTPATFLTTDPEYASRFSTSGEDVVPTPTVYPTHTSVKKTFDFENPDHVNSILNHLEDKSDINKFEISKGFWPTIEKPEVQQAIKDAGYDSFTTHEMGSKHIGVYDPSKIRSKFAAFDPKKAGSGNLSAAVGGIGLTGAALMGSNEAQAAEVGKKMPRFMSDEEMDKMSPGPAASPKPRFISDDEMAKMEAPEAPSFGTQALDTAKEFGRSTVENLPALGAMAGGTIGGVVGAGAGGIGAIPGSVAGAGLGGYAGEATKNLINTYLEPERAPKAPSEYITGPVIAGAGAAGGELLGHGIGKAVSPVMKAISTRAPKLAAKAGEFLTGVPEKEIETYAAQTGAINNMIKESGGDITVAADKVREKLQSGLRGTKSKLNGQISEYLNLAPTKPTIPITDIVQNLEVAKAKLNPNLQSEAVEQVDELLQKVKNEATADGLVNVKSLQDIKNYLMDNAKGSYLKGGQLFSKAPAASQAAKRAATQTLEILNPIAPEIQAANRQLQKLHIIEENMNKNLIAPGKPDAAITATGSGGNLRNANLLKQMGAITGQDALGEAERLAAVKRFASPSFAPVDVTGKSAFRLLGAGGLGFATGGTPGMVAVGALTSPATLKLGINAVDTIKNVIRTTGNSKAFGKFAPMIEGAAKRGPEALAVVGSMLGSNPEFQELLKGLQQ